MSKTLSIHFRVNRQQKEAIENNAKANGYNSISDYIRIRSLCFNPSEEEIHKIYEKLHAEESLKTKVGVKNKNLLEYV